MGAFVVMALIIPAAFGREASADPNGRIVYGFVVAYIVIRMVHVFLGMRASRGDPQARGTVIRTSIGGVIAGLLLLWGCSAGSLIGGHVLWGLAVIADYAFAFIFSRFGWRLVAGRFAERHGLIVIIALGETILAAGVGAEHADVNDPPTLGLAMIGVALVASLWGVYFDGTETAAECALVAAPAGIKQNTMARRAYSLLHFPLVVGAVLIALGPKFAIAHPAEPFGLHVASAFFGGLALFLLGHVGFEYVTTKRLNVPRLAVGLLMAGLIAFGTVRPSWESLVLAASIMGVLVSGQRWQRARSRAR
jgi:low temperature requirement protein LtrA